MENTKSTTIPRMYLMNKNIRDKNIHADQHKMMVILVEGKSELLLLSRSVLLLVSLRVAASGSIKTGYG